MRNLVQILFILVFFNRTIAVTNELTCAEVENSAIGRMFHFLKSEQKPCVSVKFYISTPRMRRPTLIDTGKWFALKLNSFNPNKKTYLIIHGYMSSADANWVKNLTNSLLDYSHISDRSNVFIIDWSDSRNDWNYINTVFTTQDVSRQIFEFLEALRSYVNSPSLNMDYLFPLKFNYSQALRNAREACVTIKCKTIQWNHLYFIGHSLGAHVSGQTAYLLKQNSFWIVERITGLDPAQPCFTNVNSSLKIDKSDANFVDIIHTQNGKKDDNEAFGMKAQVGHLDFYVNGGLLQPKCLKDLYLPINSMICSHKVATKYFIESIKNELNNTCPFDSQPWDGTYANAEYMLNYKRKKLTCEDCPKMGIAAEYSNSIGKYIVFTSATKPYCQLKATDITKIKEVLMEVL